MRRDLLIWIFLSNSSRLMASFGEQELYWVFSRHYKLEEEVCMPSLGRYPVSSCAVSQLYSVKWFQLGLSLEPCLLGCSD